MKRLFTMACLCIFSFALSAQQYFANPVQDFSRKKSSYITLNDGTEIEGTIKKLNRKKGLFEEITLEIDGEKTKIDAADIKHMYLPQSGLDKLGSALESAYDATQWDQSDLNAEHLKEGYAYFESAMVNYKKDKKDQFILQLLNPAFANKVRIYHDPWANETMSTSFGGIKLAGGIAKSYYLKKGDDVAYKMHKKNYEDRSEDIFGECGDYLKSIKKDLKWNKFGEQLHEYSSKECN